MENLLIGNDPQFAPQNTYSRWENFILKLIKDERDLPFVKLAIKLFALFLPAAIYLFIPGKFSWWVAGPYLALNLFVYMGPYILMLHNTSHRNLFKNEYDKLNLIIPWFLAPLFGQSPETYHSHHISMHHPENNMQEDRSSTLKYQRDSFLGFLHYFLSFLFIGLFQVSVYLRSKKRTKALRKLIIGEISFLLLMVLAIYMNPPAGMVVFLIPYLFARFAMMSGNWAQHAFIDSRDPDNGYKNSITCINTLYNRRCFNDGYHIGHHVKATRHWTDMPQDFLDNIDTYIDQESIVFKKIDYFAIWFFLMLKRYNWLAHFFVDLDSENPKSKQEIIELLKQRCRPVT